MLDPTNSLPVQSCVSHSDQPEAYLKKTKQDMRTAPLFHYCPTATNILTHAASDNAGSSHPKDNTCPGSRNHLGSHIHTKKQEFFFLPEVASFGDINL